MSAAQGCVRRPGRTIFEAAKTYAMNWAPQVVEHGLSRRGKGRRARPAKKGKCGRAVRGVEPREASRWKQRA